jgi:hypothetical protein
VRTKLWPVGPKSHEERTIQAFAPAGASPWSFERPYADCRVRAVGLDVRVALGAVEDVVGRVVDDRGAERRCVRRPADVDRRCALRIVLGTVDVVQAARAGRDPGGRGLQAAAARRPSRRAREPRARRPKTPQRARGRAARRRPLRGTRRQVARREDRRLRAPEVLDAWVRPAQALLVRIRRVVLLRHVVTEDEIGERLEAVGVAARNIDRDGFSSPMSSVKVSPTPGRARPREPSPACRRTGRPGRARGSGGRGSHRAAKGDVRLRRGFGSALSRRSSMNQPRSSSKRWSGIRSRPSIMARPCSHRSGR